MHLKAKFFDTQFTSAWTGKAEQEMQTISISSTVVDDVQVRYLYFKPSPPKFKLFTLYQTVKFWPRPNWKLLEATKLMLLE